LQGHCATCGAFTFWHIGQRQPVGTGCFGVAFCSASKPFGNSSMRNTKTPESLVRKGILRHETNHILFVAQIQGLF
jgi:hypothetical protein